MPRNDEQKSTSNRGFASMDRAKQRQIASKGGQSVPPEKRSFSQDPTLAAQAGRKGGESVPAEGRSFSQNRELAAEAGRKGGQARGALSQRTGRGNTPSKGDGNGKTENRNIAAEGARKAGLPKDQLGQDERSRLSAQGSHDDEHAEDLEDRNNLRGSQTSAHVGKEHPHGM